MKRLIQLNLLLLLISSATAQESSPWQPPKTLHVYDWKNLSAQFTNSQIISMDGISVLKIENTNNVPLKVLLLTITSSSLIQKANTIEWEMKCENVRLLNGFRLPPQMFFTSLENDLWGIKDHFTNYPNVYFFEKFPPQAAGGDNSTDYQGDYFNGTKNWDKFYFGLHRAPYDNQTRPDELKLEIFLPSSGTVYLRSIKLLGVTGSWWSAKQGAMVGASAGVFGGVIGCFGGLLGCLAGFGKARKFVLTTTKVFIALGMLLTIAGIVAIACGQPFFVWYVFLLPGVMLTLIFSLNFPLIQRRYDDLEIRRMASIDAMGS